MSENEAAVREADAAAAAARDKLRNAIRTIAQAGRMAYGDGKMLTTLADEYAQAFSTAAFARFEARRR